ncbi:hypothetical protein BJ741DRAFT_655353 [Chytriomyces cf. hyalinus JEL632]|nr:hypothetical protein BJ741DRAFT_655353 [Chytriomyces cf. hyalinus JEL632]
MPIAGCLKRTEQTVCFAEFVHGCWDAHFHVAHENQSHDGGGYEGNDEAEESLVLAFGPIQRRRVLFNPWGASVILQSQSQIPNFTTKLLTSQNSKNYPSDRAKDLRIRDRWGWGEGRGEMKEGAKVLHERGGVVVDLRGNSGRGFRCHYRPESLDNTSKIRSLVLLTISTPLMPMRQKDGTKKEFFRLVKVLNALAYDDEFASGSNVDLMDILT